MQDLLNTFNFILGNIHVAGWVVLICLSWKASRLFTKISSAIDGSDKAQETINLLATNHLPHLQSAIDGLRADMIAELRALRSDIILIIKK